MSYQAKIKRWTTSKNGKSPYQPHAHIMFRKEIFDGGGSYEGLERGEAS